MFWNLSFADPVVGKFNRLVSGLTSVLFSLGEPEIMSFQIMGQCAVYGLLASFLKVQRATVESIYALQLVELQ